MRGSGNKGADGIGEDLDICLRIRENCMHGCGVTYRFWINNSAWKM
ncbi:MAG: hypothetical protein HFI45_12140 [Lachnospiraceae bacterium]|nr:hypothetical protein [Lachnospiraceae bacterium]